MIDSFPGIFIYVLRKNVRRRKKFFIFNIPKTKVTEIKIIKVLTKGESKRNLPSTGKERKKYTIPQELSFTN